MIKEKLIKVRITEIKPISNVYKHQYICTERQAAFFPDGGKRWEVLKSSEDATHIFECGDDGGYCKAKGIWKCYCGNYFQGEKGELCGICLLLKYGLGHARGGSLLSDDYDYYEEEDVVKALREACKEKNDG